MADLDRAYVSQFSSPTFGLRIHQGGQLTDPDGAFVEVDWIRESDGVVKGTEIATRIEVGTYEVTFGSAVTEETGYFHLGWRYTMAAEPEIYRTPIEVGLANPHYDNLDDDLKEVVEQVWSRFADLFDSPTGAPHFSVYFQSRFNRGRVATLMGQGMRRINSVAQPHSSFTMEGSAKFPVAKWGPLLEQATLVETIKHFIRSYVEQPEVIGVNVARLDRRDYMNRWESVLRMEKEDLDDMLDVFKINQMSLTGKIGVLVSGGVFGTYSPTRIASAAARPRYWARFY